MLRLGRVFLCIIQPHTHTPFRSYHQLYYSTYRFGFAHQPPSIILTIRIASSLNVAFHRFHEYINDKNKSLIHVKILNLSIWPIRLTTKCFSFYKYQTFEYLPTFLKAAMSTVVGVAFDGCNMNETAYSVWWGVSSAVDYSGLLFAKLLKLLLKCNEIRLLCRFMKNERFDVYLQNW